MILDLKELNLFWFLICFCVGILIGDEVYVKVVDFINGVVINMYGVLDEVYFIFFGYMVVFVYEEFFFVVG